MASIKCRRMQKSRKSNEPWEWLDQTGIQVCEYILNTSTKSSKFYLLNFTLPHLFKSKSTTSNLISKTLNYFHFMFFLYFIFIFYTLATTYEIWMHIKLNWQVFFFFAFFQPNAIRHAPVPLRLSFYQPVHIARCPYRCNIHYAVPAKANLFKLKVNTHTRTHTHTHSIAPAHLHT